MQLISFGLTLSYLIKLFADFGKSRMCGSISLNFIHSISGTTKNR